MYVLVFHFHLYAGFLTVFLGIVFFSRLFWGLQNASLTFHGLLRVSILSPQVKCGKFTAVEVPLSSPLYVVAVICIPSTYNDGPTDVLRILVSLLIMLPESLNGHF